VADLKAEAARYHAAFIKANEAVTVRELAIDRLTAERDRARDIAVALEGQVAAVWAVLEGWEQRATEPWDDWRREGWLSHAHQIRAALDPDPAEET